MPPGIPPRISKRPGRTFWLGSAALLLGLLAAAVLCWQWIREPVADRPATEVPLGVEQAVIVRYRGPRLVARPYRRGASVNLRIAHEQRREDLGVYDVRYVINLPGQFDLTRYLMAADGSELADLPAFPVRGLTSLTKDIETRIQEIQPVRITIGHRYYETLAGLAALWLVWLAGLILVGRPKRERQAAAEPPPPPIAERIDRLLEAVRARPLSVDEQAELEALLLLHWREQLGLDDARMADCCRRIAASEALGQPYAVLRSWLHNGRSGADGRRFLECYEGAAGVPSPARPPGRQG